MAATGRALPDSLETVSIVLLGSFQLDEFEPSNLWKLGCIETGEHEVGKIGLRLPDTFAIRYPSLHIVAEMTKIAVNSTVEEPVFERAKEFFLCFFSNSKNHAASALGINNDFHRRVENLERWHAIGHNLVPKATWHNALKLQNAGLLSVAVESTRPDGENGAVKVRAEPSTLLRPGVYVQINDHFDLKAENGIEDALRIVNTHWKDCRQRHLEITSAIMGLR
jgi:hypothetical protein